MALKGMILSERSQPPRATYARFHLHAMRRTARPQSQEAGLWLPGAGGGEMGMRVKGRRMLFLGDENVLKLIV